MVKTLNMCDFRENEGGTFMASVSRRVGQAKQPYGGYLSIRSFDRIRLPIENELYLEENIHPSLIGLSVDYLTRYILGTDKKKAFEISLKGARNDKSEDYALSLLEDINGLDDQSIINACKLTGYDVLYRVGRMHYKPVEEINPDDKTIKNIREMVNRAKTLFDKVGPIVLEGFTLEGSYTDLITVGEGDFLTNNTLWDFKVTKSVPNKNHTLQLLIYYLMGLRSIHKDYFEKVENLAIFNPRMNIIYIIKADGIDDYIIDEVCSKIIGY